MSDEPYIAISKAGFDADTADAKDLKFDSRLDTFKIKKTGRLILNVPAQRINDGERYEYFARWRHQLGYRPFYHPKANRIDYWDPIGTPASYYLNDELEEALPPAGAFSPPLYIAEQGDVLITEEQIVLRVVSKYIDLFPPATPFIDRMAYQIYVDFTVFYNRADPIPRDMAIGDETWDDLLMESGEKLFIEG
jgi:hypothetical protein